MIGVLRRRRLSAWLAVLALGLNALVPIHLALDLGEALSAARYGPPAGRHGLEWRLLALAAGHAPGDGKPDADSHRPVCPACGALGALGGFATVAGPALLVPAVLTVPPMPAALAEETAPGPAAAYRSRAPPLG